MTQLSIALSLLFVTNLRASGTIVNGVMVDYPGAVMQNIGVVTPADLARQAALAAEQAAEREAAAIALKAAEAAQAGEMELVKLRLLAGRASQIAADEAAVAAATSRTLVIKTAGRLLMRILGPIAWAYTAGEVGAYVITEAGKNRAGQIEWKFACDHLSEVENLKNRACNEWQDAKDDFEGDYCSIDYASYSNSCGPSGIRKFEASSGCQDILVSADEESIPTQAFARAASGYTNCLSKIRLYNDYFRTCNVLPPC